jgi:hypothetical protein
VTPKCEGVLLTRDEAAEVRRAATKRFDENRRNGRRGFHPLGDGKSDMIGALGERVVAKALGMRWDGMYYDDAEWQRWRTEGHDVGPLEVKATARQDGHLLIPKHNARNAVYVFVVVNKRPTRVPCEIRGWCVGRDVMLADRLKDGRYDRPYYEVPHAALRPIGELRRSLAAREHRKDRLG